MEDIYLNDMYEKKQNWFTEGNKILLLKFHSFVTIVQQVAHVYNKSFLIKLGLY